MQKHMGPLPIVWARKVLPALWYILPSVTFQYHCLFEVRLAKGQKEGSLLLYHKCLTVLEVLCVCLYALP